VYAGIDTALVEQPWRPGASRHIILMGDAPPHDDYSDDPRNFHAVITRASAAPLVIRSDVDFRDRGEQGLRRGNRIIKKCSSTRASSAAVERGDDRIALVEQQVAFARHHDLGMDVGRHGVNRLRADHHAPRSRSPVIVRRRGAAHRAAVLHRASQTSGLAIRSPRARRGALDEISERQQIEHQQGIEPFAEDRISRGTLSGDALASTGPAPRRSIPGRGESGPRSGDPAEALALRWARGTSKHAEMAGTATDW
jgi:hypothetical protein